MARRRVATTQSPQPDAGAVTHARVALAALSAHRRNYRRHPDAQVQRLAASLSRFGQVRSIVVQVTPDGYRTVAGHGVVQAAATLGWEMLAADIIPADWTDAQVDGYLVADNEHARGAEDDLEALAALLEAQRDEGMDLAALGYSEDELSALLAQLEGERDHREVDDPGGGGDDFDTTPETGPTRSQRGDLWQLGAHRLLCGDSTKREDVARLMDGAMADMMWTDPPYGVSYVGKTAEALTIQRDDADGLGGLLQDVFACADEVLDSGAAIYVAGPPGQQGIPFIERFNAQWPLRQMLVWVKDSMVLGHSDYHYRHEMLFYGFKPGEGRLGRGGDGWYGDNAQTSVFDVPRPKRSEEHPTMKPVVLVARMVANSSRTGDSVYDPFLGSGSTLIAAERLGRRCSGLEIEPRYCDVILRRWEAETGQVAVRLEAGVEASA